MGRSQESFHKKEVRNKKEKKRKEKEAKRLAKKESVKAGSSLDEMMAYVDEFGNITNEPPDPLKKKEEINAEDIEIGIPKKEHDDQDSDRSGRISFFNDSKGYGFIKDDHYQDSIFVHINNIDGDPRENDKVTFEVEKGAKGLVAVNVKII